MSPEITAGHANAEHKERQPQSRLEAYLFFVRHGVAEKLEGDDVDNEIDANRKHTEQGKKEAYEAGKQIAVITGLKANDAIFSRSSYRDRAVETRLGVLEGFEDALAEQGNKRAEIKSHIQQSAKPRMHELDYGNHTLTYAAGAERNKTTKGLSEQWTRAPELLQQDSNLSGFGHDVNRMLKLMADEYQNTVATMDRATTLLAEKWNKYKEQKDGKLSQEEQDTPPRLIEIQGSHGFRTEPWLLKVVEDYENEVGTKLRIEMNKGGFFYVHWPENPKEAPTLHLGSAVIPIKLELLEHLKNLLGKTTNYKELT